MAKTINAYFLSQYQQTAKQSMVVFARRQLNIQYGIDVGTLKLEHEKRFDPETINLDTWVLALAAIKVWLASELAHYALSALTPYEAIQVITSVLTHNAITHTVWHGHVADVFGSERAVVDHVWVTLCDRALTIDYHLASLLQDSYMPHTIFLNWQLKRASYKAEDAIQMPILSSEALKRLKT